MLTPRQVQTKYIFIFRFDIYCILFHRCEGWQNYLLMSGKCSISILSYVKRDMITIATKTNQEMWNPLLKKWRSLLCFGRLLPHHNCLLLL